MTPMKTITIPESTTTTVFHLGQIITAIVLLNKDRLLIGKYEIEDSDRTIVTDMNGYRYKRVINHGLDLNATFMFEKI